MAVALAYLAYPAAGAEAEPPLVIAHGLFGSARNWNMLARRLSARRRVLAVDLRNHGDSPWDGANTYPDMAADLAEFILREANGAASVLGHSMGGKAAMTLALSAPELVEALVVADIAPVAYRHSHSGYVAAMLGVDLSAVRRRSDADLMLAEAIPEPPLRSFILQNLVMAGGVARWRLNLDAIASDMDAIRGFPADLPHAVYERPALFVHGDASDYVTPRGALRIRALFPDARIEAIPGAGHWLHAERPDEFLSAVEGFLTSVYRRPFA